LDIVSGRNQRAVESDDGPYPIYGSGGVIGTASAYLCEAGTTIIGRKGSINRPIFVDRPFWNVDTAFGLSPRTGLDPMYLFRFCELYDFARHNKGTTLPSLVKTDLLRIAIPLPPLPEQQRIVAVLDEALEGIDKARENAEKNLRNARAVFESRLDDVFRVQRVGDITAIGEIAQVFDGPHATPKTVDSGPVFLGISALEDGVVNLAETRHVTPADFVTWTRRVRPQADDVVFSYETRLGQAAIIPHGLECCLGRRMGLIRLHRDRVNPRFFVLQYISPPFRRFLDARTIHGATVDRLAIREVSGFPVWVPSTDEQESIVTELEALRSATERLEVCYMRKLGALDELKQSVLHQAFSGEL